MTGLSIVILTAVGFAAQTQPAAPPEPVNGPQRVDRARSLLRTYRYTSAPALLEEARRHLAQAGDTFEVRKTQAWALILDEDYPAGLERALELNRKAPDDVEIYGYLVDAYTALGDYKKAEENANWMLRLRPQHRETLRRAAELREAFGDTEGAGMMLNDLYKLIPASEELERAWILARLAGFSKDPKRAAQLAKQALHIAPESLEAARAVARFAPEPEGVAALTQAAERTARADVALRLALLRKEPALFEKTPPQQRPSAVEARIEYLLEHAHRPAEALALAQVHGARYRNVWGLAWYAAALQANGRKEQAAGVWKQVDEIGSKDARLTALRQTPPQQTTPPDDPQAAVRTARDYMRRMRETTDYGYADRARKLVDRVLAADPAHYDALQVLVEIHLFRHEFSQVAARSRELAARKPNDPVNYATLGDALMETGDYDGAADAYQKMVNLRADLMSYNRVGWWRFVNGDSEGALDMMQRAVRAGRPNQESTAWCLVEVGHLLWKAGRVAEAQGAYRAALAQFPRMHSAYAGLGHTLAAQGKPEEAIAALRNAQNIAPMVEYSGALADLYAAAGKPEEARKQLQLVELQARMEAASGQKANRQIALIFANHQHRLEEALEIAEADLAVRKDVFTWDAYSWVLYKLGKVAEAREASRQALRTRTPDPLLLYHAGIIAQAAGDPQQARTLLDHALRRHPRFDPREAPLAQAALEKLTAGARTGPGSPSTTPRGAVE